MSALDSARALARHIHTNDDSLDGTPLIDHLIRVADAVADDEVTRMVAMFHHANADTLIERRFGVRVVRALRALSRLAEEPDRPYFWRVGRSGDNHAVAVVRACMVDSIETTTGARRARWIDGLRVLDSARDKVDS